MSLIDSLGLELASSLLIKDSLDAPGNFLLPQLLRAALKEGYMVVLVLVKEPLAHYQHVLRKLGVNLPNSIAEQQVVVFNLISTTHLAESLQSLTEKLQAAVHCEQLGNTRGVSLIFDSLSELHSLHCAQRNNVWIDFLVDLLALGDHVKGPFSFAMLVHEDIEEDRPWISLLEHSCGVMIRVDKLESGHSSYVNGQMHMYTRLLGASSKRASQGPAEAPSSKRASQGPAEAPYTRYLYKLEESGTQISPTVHGLLAA